VKVPKESYELSGQSGRVFGSNRAFTEFFIDSLGLVYSSEVFSTMFPCPSAYKMGVKVGYFTERV
jgi:hypothetical protein